MSEREHNENLWSIYTRAESEQLLDPEFRKANGLPAEGPPPELPSMCDVSPPLGKAAPASGHGAMAGAVSPPLDHNVAAAPAAPTAAHPGHGDVTPPLDNRKVAAAAPAADLTKHGE